MDAPYRKSVEALYNYRIEVCDAENDVQRVEQVLGLGQIEEVIEMGRDELSLIPKYIELRLHESAE